MKEFKINITNKDESFSIIYKVDAENIQQAKLHADNQIKQAKSKRTGKLTAKIEEVKS